nr:unnamed protein product [Callosobruchus chinensis]
MILDVLGITENDNRQHIPSIPDAKGSKRCAVCPRSQDRKGRDNCVKCGRNLCAEHRHDICIFCIQSKRIKQVQFSIWSYISSKQSWGRI